MATLWLILALYTALPEVTLASQFDYLYVNANEGTASGGHVAIRFDDEVFHFQHASPGLLRLTREPFEHFRFEYGDRENRTIRSHSIAVSEDSFRRLRQGFDRYWLSQNEQFERLRSLDMDIQLLELLLRLRSSDTGMRLSLPAAGYFVSDGWSPSSDQLPIPAVNAPRNASLGELHRRLENELGAHYLERRWQSSQEALAALDPGSEPPAKVSPESTFTPLDVSFARRYLDQLTALAALAVLSSELPLQPHATRQGLGRRFHLSEAEVNKLRQFREILLNRMTGLLRSPGADWGFPLLVGMARLTALDASIAQRRLIVVDRLAVHQSPASGTPTQGYNWRTAIVSAQTTLDRALAALKLSEDLNERTYGRLESAANRLDALTSDWYAGKARPTWAMPAIPDRMVAVLPEPIDAPTEVLGRRLGRLRNLRSEWNRQLLSLYGYDLLTNNCVTKLFQLIDQSIAGESENVKHESEARLGGYIAETASKLIPFLSFKSVGATYRVIASQTLESYRHRQLRQSEPADDPLWISLRESNTLTSLIYTANDEDAPFLFFTDGAVWARPLLGASNLAVGAANSLAGLALWPHDSGNALKRSLKGMAISLPELFFVNIRKGSFPNLTESTAQITH